MTLNANYKARGRRPTERHQIFGEYKKRKRRSAGVDCDDFRRQDSTMALPRNTGAASITTNKIVSAAKVEDNVSFNYDSNYQGFAAVKLNY